MCGHQGIRDCKSRQEILGVEEIQGSDVTEMAHDGIQPRLKGLMECERRKGLSNPILGEKWAGSGGREKVKRKLRIQQMKL